MTISTTKALIATYMNQFSCIGSDCEDTCCAGWSIVIDKPTYLRYKQIEHVELKPRFERHLQRIEVNDSDQRYAVMEMTADNRCPMLDDTQLCRIQKNVGESCLSVVCNNYPRQYQRVNQVLEMSANVSCPEIARLALLNPNGIDFEEIECDFEPHRHVPKMTFDTNDEHSQGKPEMYFWDLRIFTIELLQNRSYSLEIRLIILGMFYESIQTIIDQGNIQDIPVWIERYRQQIATNSLDLSRSSNYAKPSQRIVTTKMLLDHRVQKGFINERFAECYAAFICGIGYTDQASPEHLDSRYETLYIENYKTYMDTHEYILENYLVNNVFKQLFPFGNARSVFDHYLLMIINVAVLKIVLVGATGYHHALNDELIIRFIQSYSKTIEHHQEYAIERLDRLKSQATLDLDWVASMIND